MTEGDPIRINPRSFVEATGQYPLLPLLENLKDARMHTLRQGSFAPNRSLRVNQHQDILMTVSERLILLYLTST